MQRIKGLALLAFAAVSLGAAAAGTASGPAKDGRFEVAQAQGGPVLGCAILASRSSQTYPPASYTAGACGASVAGSGYGVYYRVTGGSGNYSYAWHPSIQSGTGSCTSTSPTCGEGTYPAKPADQEGTASVTVTDLGTGGVTTLHVSFYIPATCGRYYFC